MPEFTSYAAGTPSWVDHAAKDLAGSNAFYSSLFGWEADDQGEEMGHYTLMRKGGKSVAGNMGVMGRVSRAHGSPTSPWTTPTQRSIVPRRRGPPSSSNPWMWRTSGVWRSSPTRPGLPSASGSPRSFAGAELANEPGSFAWNELNTRDVPAAKAFYTDVFGWTPNDLDMDGMQYTEWRIGEKSVAGMMTMPDMVPAEVPAHWLVYFGTEDTDATAAKASELGAMTLVPPTDIPPGRFAVLMDPDGAAFAVIKMAPMPA